MWAQVKEHMRAFWGILLRPVVDLNELPVQAALVLECEHQARKKKKQMPAENTKGPSHIACHLADAPIMMAHMFHPPLQARSYYLRLVEKFPNSVGLLRAYGSFVWDIQQDEDLADELFAKADQLEESNSAVPGPAGPALPGEAPQGRPSRQQKGTKRTLPPAPRRSSLRFTLWHMLPWACMPLVALCALWFSWSGPPSLDLVYAAGNSSALAQEVPTLALLLEVFAQEGSELNQTQIASLAAPGSPPYLLYPGATFGTLGARLRTRATSLRAIMRGTLAVATAAANGVSLAGCANVWTTKCLNTTQILYTNGRPTATSFAPQSLWDLLGAFADLGLFFANAPAAHYRSESPSDALLSDLAFVLANRDILRATMHAVTAEYASRMASSSSVALGLSLGLAGVLSVIFLAGSVLVYRTRFRAVNDERATCLSFFMAIPRSVVEDMHANFTDAGPDADLLPPDGSPQPPAESPAITEPHELAGMVPTQMVRRTMSSASGLSDSSAAVENSSFVDVPSAPTSSHTAAAGPTGASGGLFLAPPEARVSPSAAMPPPLSPFLAASPSNQSGCLFPTIEAAGGPQLESPHPLDLLAARAAAISPQPGTTPDPGLASGGAGGLGLGVLGPDDLPTEWHPPDESAPGQAASPPRHVPGRLAAYVQLPDIGEGLPPPSARPASEAPSTAPPSEPEQPEGLPFGAIASPPADIPGAADTAMSMPLIAATPVPAAAPGGVLPSPGGSSGLAATTAGRRFSSLLGPHLGTGSTSAFSASATSTGLTASRPGLSEVAKMKLAIRHKRRKVRKSPTALQAPRPALAQPAADPAAAGTGAAGRPKRESTLRRQNRYVEYMVWLGVAAVVGLIFVVAFTGMGPLLYFHSASAEVPNKQAGVKDRADHEIRSADRGMKKTHAPPSRPIAASSRISTLASATHHLAVRLAFANRTLLSPAAYAAATPALEASGVMLAATSPLPSHFVDRLEAAGGPVGEVALEAVGANLAGRLTAAVEEMDMHQSTRLNHCFPSLAALGGAALPAVYGLLPGTANRLDRLEALYYDNSSCLLWDAAGCLADRLPDMVPLQTGLQGLVDVFGAKGRRLAALGRLPPYGNPSPAAPLAALSNFTDFAQLLALAQGDMRDGLERVTFILAGEGLTQATTVLALVLSVLSSMLLVQLLVDVCFFRGANSILQKESDMTRRMLTMVPPLDSNTELMHWDETVQLGVPAVDQQHHRLVELANDMYRSMITQQAREYISEIFGGLVQYTLVHFKDESVLRHADAWKRNEPGADFKLMRFLVRQPRPPTRRPAFARHGKQTDGAPFSGSPSELGGKRSSGKAIQIVMHGHGHGGTEASHLLATHSDVRFPGAWFRFLCQSRTGKVDWLLHHIKGSDREYANLYQEAIRQGHAPPDVALRPASEIERDKEEKAAREEMERKARERKAQEEAEMAAAAAAAAAAEGAEEDEVDEEGEEEGAEVVDSDQAGAAAGPRDQPGSEAPVPRLACRLPRARPDEGQRRAPMGRLYTRNGPPVRLRGGLDVRLCSADC
ncbi:hypothetical protein PAPYR_1373 [Paratrimastix pyriformis]|uniref:TmcB/TmcC TPR repeats domain-containing protein n=1 Tax=Paratrimastix pyriformis TaxID=342808 RepID=A0ABQ8UUG9_9EUKA|nr:hypothetical protein PAPYR_1373 [Paratrimastix pyriformis]